MKYILYFKRFISSCSTFTKMGNKLKSSVKYKTDIPIFISELPVEIYTTIAGKVDDQQTYYNLRLSCKRSRIGCDIYHDTIINKYPLFHIYTYRDLKKPGELLREPKVLFNVAYSDMIRVYENSRGIDETNNPLSVYAPRITLGKFDETKINFMSHHFPI